MDKYLLENNIKFSEGINVVKVDKTSLFNANLGVLVISKSNETVMLAHETYYKWLIGIISSLECSDIYEANFISILESKVSQSFLLLSGPYHLLSAQPSKIDQPDLNFELVRHVNDTDFLNSNKDFSHAIDLNFKKDFIAYSLEVAGKVVAIVSATHEGSNVYSLGIEVKPNYQKHGIGSFLISTITNELIKENKELYYQTSINNIASVKTALKANYQLYATLMYTV